MAGCLSFATGYKGRERRATGSVQAVRGTPESTAGISVKYLTLRDIARPHQGERRGGVPPLPGVWGCPPSLPRAGGWEQPGSCCGEDADAAHRAQLLAHGR